MKEINLFNVDTNEDKKYTTKVNIPQYLPKNEKPNINELADFNKYKQLMLDIDKSNVSDMDKEFLKFAATRHIVFNYSKIADYYAHSSPEMQRLMEESALVIIDVDDAIANGYVKLSESIKKIINDNGRMAKDVYRNQTTPKKR